MVLLLLPVAICLGKPSSTSFYLYEAIALGLLWPMLMAMKARVEEAMPCPRACAWCHLALLMASLHFDMIRLLNYGLLHGFWHVSGPLLPWPPFYESLASGLDIYTMLSVYALQWMPSPPRRHFH